MPSLSKSVAGEPRVLVVCTANISRSPTVELLLRSGLGDTVNVGSAGVMALAGHPLDAKMTGYLRTAGLDPDGFVARQVTADLLRAANLVLTLTREHRSRVLELVPANVRRSFTLVEFARVLGSLDLSALPTGLTPGERLWQILPLAIAGRPLAPRPRGKSDDIVDPFGRSAAVYDEAFAGIRDASTQIVQIVCGD
ncbi:hypothetical protein [Micropruina sp.]|uniref:arsenate reductase/protein-tyrosine-phosphatase family protein n=1 Tax=Micropruina sp. TaxID=2737536 RepID=UPI0039E6CBE6